MTEYVAELRRLAQSCNYGATLEQMLRDRIVCGINDDRIQRRLLADYVIIYRLFLFYYALFYVSEKSCVRLSSLLEIKKVSLFMDASL